MQKITIRFGFSIGLVFLVGIGLVFLGRPSGWLSNIGEAFIVAAILAAVVDTYVKTKLATEVAKDISPYAVGHFLPNEVKEEIRSLLRVPLVRRNFEIRYALTRIDAHPNFLRTSVRLSYRVENLTDVSQECEQYLWTEKSFFADVGEARIDGMGVIGGKAPYTLRPGDADFKIEQLGHTIKISKKVVIPKFLHEDLLFWGEYSEVLRDAYSDYVALAAPTIGITLDVECPEDTSVEVFFIKRGDVKAIPPDNPKRWSHGGVFLPGENVQIRWRPKVI